jgi:predicted sulfurtransferase
MRKTILLFYKYVQVADPMALLHAQKELGTRLGLTGRVIVASEGINGTVGGSDEAVDAYLKEFLAHPDFADTEIKRSQCNGIPFGNGKFKVLLRSEIVRLGIDPQELPFTQAAPRLSPAQAHALITQRQGQSDFVILDTRNTYESEIGAFQGAVTPPIDTFAQLPKYLQDHAEQFKDKDVLMYCTGGVRCERASAYLQSLGIARQVNHIAGGIDCYVQDFPEGYFKGHNYVFDGRVTVPVTDDMLASCYFCPQAGRTMTNCSYARCNKQLILCRSCAAADGLPDPQSTIVCSFDCAHRLQEFPERKRAVASVTACPITIAR